MPTWSHVHAGVDGVGGRRRDPNNLPFMVRGHLGDAQPARKIGLVVRLMLAIGGAHGLHRLAVIDNRVGRERGQIGTSQDLRTD